MRFGVKNVVKNILDGVFPPRCRGCGEYGDYLCECCKKYISEKMKARRVETGEEGVSAVYLGYRDEILGEVAEEAKYESVRGELDTLAEVVWRGYFEKNMGRGGGSLSRRGSRKSKAKTSEVEVILVPMPTSRKHVRQRGLDHTDKVCREIERLSLGRVRRVRLLVRVKDTVQVGASEKVRKAQAKEAVRVNPRFLDAEGRIIAEVLRGVRVVIMDDVWTTGASLTEAGRMLREAGVSEVELLAITKNRARRSPVIRHGEISVN